MSDFGLSDSPAGGLDSSKRAQLVDQVKSQIAVAAAQELLQVSHYYKYSTKLMQQLRWNSSEKKHLSFAWTLIS